MLGKALETFEQQTNRLLQELGRPASDRAPEAVVKDLAGELQGEELRLDKHRDATGEIEEERRAAEELRARLAALGARLDEAASDCGLEDRETLRHASDACIEREEVVVEKRENEAKLQANLERGGDAAVDFEGLDAADADALQTEAQRLSELEEEVQARSDALRVTLGGLRNQEADLGSELGVRARAAFEEVRSELESQVDRYTELWLARTVLTRVMETFVQENQPALLRRASELLLVLTEGDHTRVLADPARDGLFLESRDGTRRGPEELSTGTFQQLFLALRIAYVLIHAEQSEPLPVVMDDVLVNIDERRQRATLRALAEVGRSLQVIYLTCHASFAARARATIPDVHIVDLDKREENAHSSTA